MPPHLQECRQLTLQTGAINLGSVLVTAAEEADSFHDRCYVDLPTLDFPDGEIRGQLLLVGLIEVPEPGQYAVLAVLGLAGFGVWRRHHPDERLQSARRIQGTGGFLSASARPPVRR